MKQRTGILVVDDTLASLRLITDTLASEGFTVRPASNGEQALRAVASETPELILLDVRMLGLDGFEVCRRLQADESTKSIPILFLSSSTESEERVMGLGLGAVDFIPKPFQKEELLARVRTHLELSRLRFSLEDQVFKQTKDLRDAYDRIQKELQSRIETEEKNFSLEAQLQQAQKMESIGQLAGGVAHDFNNMLCVITGYTELALMNMDKKSQIYSDLQEVMKAASRSADLTRQLLAFARKESIQPKVLDLNETIEGMLKMLRRLIGENIHLAWNPNSEPLLVNIDPSQIDQMLANLCVNARDAIDGIGSVAISLYAETISSEKADLNPDMEVGEFVVISVSDSGMGISDEVMKRIFEPFYTTKQIGKGTGLGLSTVYGAVKQNDGFIQVKSTLAVGTTFSLFLPRYFGEKEQIKVSLSSSITSDKTILIVEDEISILTLATAILKQSGFTVIDSHSPEEAIQLSRKYRGVISILLTDVIMPEMNGHELAKLLTAERPDIKPLFMSGYTSDVISREGVLHEGINFIPKPFTAAALLNKISELLMQVTM